MKRLRIAILALALAACQPAPNAPPPVTTGVEYICASSAFSLRLATRLFDQLTPAQRTTVDTAARRINPVCSAVNPPTLDSAARAALDAALAQISDTTKGL